MPIFPEANNVLISNGTFSDHSHNMDVHLNLDSSKGIKTLLAASIPDAAHDSSARDPPRCFPGTREQYIKDITLWAFHNRNNCSPPIFWMRGPAGVGKSALAQTCVEIVKAAGKLGAAFFFSTISGRDNPKRFFTSLAYQMSMNSRPYRDLLDNKIGDDETLVSKSMLWQFEELIVHPFQELCKDGEPVEERIVFIDGLDECMGVDAQCEIIKIIAASVRHRSAPFRWAFFSRPEPHIEATFAKREITPLCLKVVLPISRQVDGEIKEYLRNGFQDILLLHNISTSGQWPSEKDIQALVDAAAGLFIYAATVLRFIRQAGLLGPEEPLRAVLSVISNQPNPIISDMSSKLFAELDAFYTLILQRVPDDILSSVQSFLLLLSIVSETKYEWCAMQVANLLGFSEIQFTAICNKLHAVVQLEDNQRRNVSHDGSGPSGINCSNHLSIKGSLKPLTPQIGGSITFYHKSFADFLNDRSRSGSFCVRVSAVANGLFGRCLKLHPEFVRSYHFQESELQSLLLASDILPPWKNTRSRLPFLHLAPNVASSASSLTLPYKDECMNALLKVRVYRLLVEIALQLHLAFSLDLQLLRQLEDVNYRQLLRIYSTSEIELQLTGESHLTGVLALNNSLDPNGEYQRLFDAASRRLPKELQHCKIIRPYAPGILSRCRSLVRRVTPFGGKILYVIGSGDRKLYLCRSNFTEYLASDPFH